MLSMRHFSNFLDGYTADKVKYLWSTGAIQSLKLHKIRLPDFQVKEAYVTSRVESYATGRYFYWQKSY